MTNTETRFLEDYSNITICKTHEGKNLTVYDLTVYHRSKHRQSKNLQTIHIVKFVTGLHNLVPRLSSLRSSLEEETHVAPRFWEPTCEGWWVVLVNVCNFVLYLMKNATRLRPVSTQENSPRIGPDRNKI